MADDIIKVTVDVDDSNVLKSIKNQKKLEKAIEDVTKGYDKLRKAHKDGIISEERFRRGTEQVRKQQHALINTLGSGTVAIDKWATHVNQAKNRTNRFGMVAQQVGYQVGDFFVQVQSGTSALVAFGQQGTQLAGLLPGVAGAVIGIGLSLGTMLLRTFLDTKDAGKQLEESIKGVENALSNLSNVSSMLRDTLGAPFSEANTQLKEYLELLEKSSAAKVQDAIALAFGTKGESTGILNELKVLADDMTNIPLYQMEWLRDLVGVQYGPTSEEIANAEDILRVREEIAEILRGTAAQPRIIEGAEGLRELGDDLLAYSKKFNGALGERIRTLMFEAGLTQLMVDAEKAKGDAAEKSEAATNANLDAQLELLMKQYEEQLKIDALIKKAHKKEKARLTDKLSIASAEYFSLKNADEGARIEKVKADIARRLFIESRKALGITGAKLQAEIGLYDAVQKQLGLNKEITEEMAKQLALKNAIVSKTRGNLEGLGIIEGSTVSKEFYDDKRAAELRAKYQALGKEGPKGKEPTTMEGPIKALERQIELSKALFGLEGQSRREQEIFMQLQFQNRDADKKAKEEDLRALAEDVAKQEELTKVFEEQRQAQKDLADTIANSMGDALMSMVDGTKSVKDAFKDMARAIIAELYQIYVVKQITGMISGGIDSFMGFNASASANGNVFSNGNLVPYADGGVVGGPTYFPMNDGRTGLMGEAGPEAIMPLKRGKDGKLGVQAEGGAGDVIIHQNFNFTANGDESVKKIIAQQAPAIANMTKNQILDDRRRGGQMKQAFG